MKMINKKTRWYGVTLHLEQDEPGEPIRYGLQVQQWNGGEHYFGTKRPTRSEIEDVLIRSVDDCAKLGHSLFYAGV